MTKDTIVGRYAHPKHGWIDLILIDRSKEDELELTRVMFRDHRNRRVTLFVKPNQVVEFNQPTPGSGPEKQTT